MVRDQEEDDDSADTSTEDENETEDSDKKEEGGDWTYAVAASLVALIILLLAIVFFVFYSGSSKSSQEQVVESEGKGGGGGEGGGAAANDTKESSRLKTSDNSQTRAAKTTTERDPHFALISTTTTQAPMPTETLLCTVRSNLVPNSPVPDDGLCDIIFYDSMIENGSINMMGGPYTPAFTYFLQMANEYNKTESGVSLEVPEKRESSPFADILNKTYSKTQEHIFDLWSQKIYHFGILETLPTCNSDKTCLPLLLRVLKVIFDMLDGKRSNERPCYTVFSSTFYDPGVAIQYLNGLYKGILASNTTSYRNTLNVPGHGLVFLGHFMQKEPEIPPGNCRIIPPLFIHSPPMAESVPINNKTGKPYRTYAYYWNMNITHIAVKEWSKRLYAPQAAFMSCTLEGRKYATRDEDPGFLSLCGDIDTTNTRNASMTEVCDSSSYNVTSVDELGSIARHLSLNLAVTYDDAESFRYKFCTMKKPLASVKYGIMAYSVNTDDATDKCHRGKYHRLKTLRWLVNFFKRNFTSKSDVDSCIRGETTT